MRCRRKFKEVYQNVSALRGVPVPGWRVLLSPGGLSRWVQWAGRAMAARHKGERPLDAGDEEEVVAPYMLDTWEEFKRQYGSY